MTDYWVSKGNYWCKARHCHFLTDDAPSRQQHESGLKHKERQRTFVNRQYKEAEHREREKANEARAIASINQVRFPGILGGEGAAGDAPPPPAAGTSKAKPAASRDPYANYSTAASLGYHDDGERFTSGGQEGVIGQWQTVLPSAAPPKPSEEPV
ncbi:hypothetical protein BT69DRAFT_1200959, partial [Atractiella rhizophila]